MNDDPLNPTQQQQIENELKKQNEQFGDVDPDEEASEVVDLDPTEEDALPDDEGTVI